jgi:hypothetical protein
LNEILTSRRRWLSTSAAMTTGAVVGCVKIV